MRKTLFVAATSAVLFAASSVQAATMTLTPSNGQGVAIQQALKQLNPGDTLYLAGGDYYPSGDVPGYIDNTLDIRPTGDDNGINPRGRNGTATNWITVRNVDGQKPVLHMASGKGGFTLHNVAYWRVEGLEVVADSSNHIDGAGLAASGTSHHIQFVNNTVHGFGAAGIEAGGSSQILIEGNTVYDNCHRSKKGASGINLAGLKMQSNDNSGVGGTLGNPNNNAYAMIVRNNRVYYNRNEWYVEGHGTGDDITDGNGIIVDFTDETGFTGKTLVANNIIYNNGGAGIQVFKSSNVDVFHNTLYQNAWNANGTQLSNAGPIPNSGAPAGQFNRFFNNIVVGGNPNIKTGYYLNAYSEAFGANRGGQDAFNNGQWDKNLFFNTAPFQDFGGNILGYPYGSIIADPRFVNAKLETTSAPTADFHIQANSPAINTGLSSSTTNITKDYELGSRDSSPDLGADEFAGTPALVDRTLESGGTVASDAGDNGGSEDKYKAFDNNINTKWLGYSSTPYLQYGFANGANRVISRYVITSGNDEPSRDPVSWRLQGSNDPVNGFVTLDTQTNQSFVSRKLSKVYHIPTANVPASPGYKYYRLKIDSIVSGTAVQISELRLWGPSSTSTPIAISNASFESNTGQSPANWSTWPSTAGSAADYVETGGAYAGNNRLTHWMPNNAYQVYTYRIITGLTNGNYTLRAWTKSSGGQASATMTVKNPTGGSPVSTNIPTGSSWTQREITFTINSTSGTGQAEIGFWSSASANQWITVDDVTLAKN